MRPLAFGILALAVLCGLSPFTDKPSISRLTPQPIDWRDVMDFLNLRAWKMRVGSDQPFNTMTVTLGLHERHNNNTFVRQTIGEPLEILSLTKLHEQLISVLWRNEDTLVRFHVSCPGVEFFDATLPTHRIAGYVPAGDGNPSSGFVIDGQHIIAVKWKPDAPVHAPEKRYMDGYIAVQFELAVLKGLND